MSDPKKIQEAAKATRDLKLETQETVRFTRDINNEARELLSNIKKEKDLRTSTLGALREANKLAEAQVDLVEEGAKALFDQEKLQKRQITFQKNIAKLELNKKDLIDLAGKAQAKLDANRAKMSKEQIEAAEDEIKLANDTAEVLADQVANQTKSKELVDQQVEASKELNKLGSVKLFGSLEAIADAIPGAKNLTSAFSSASVKAKGIAANMLQAKIESKETKDVSLTLGESLKAGFQGAVLGANELLKAFGPIAIFAKVFEGLMKADESAGEIAKGLNLSFGEAKKLSSELNKTALSSDQIGVTYEGQKHALMAINAELGTSSEISAKQLATFSKLEELAGMTQEEIKGIASLQLSTGKDAEKITSEFLAQAKISSVQNGVLLNEKKLMADIAKVSAATTLSLGQNPKELAKAVATAKALGMELDELESVADSLLDFESSIENEMQAELMLGKNLNLERARAAALNNDLATLAEEIADQAGSAAEFTKMNRLQQEALADAVGMSREDLAETLFTQEQLRGLTGEAAEAEKKKLNTLIETQGINAVMEAQEAGTLQNLFDQASQQEKMALSAKELNAAFMEMGSALMPVFQLLTSITTTLAENLALTGSLIVGYKLYNALVAANNAGKIFGIALDKKALMFGKSKLAQLAAQAVVFALANPFKAALGAALAVGIGAIAYGAISKAGDINSPAKGKTQISTKEGGLFELSGNDDIVAAPGASAALAGMGRGGSSRSDELQAQTNNLLKKVLNRPAPQPTIVMNDQELGTAINMGAFSIQ